MANCICPSYRNFFYDTTYHDNYGEGFNPEYQEDFTRDESIVCLYHSADNDGKLSGNLIARVFDSDDKVFIGMNFEDFDSIHFLSIFPNLKKLFIVDYSLEPLHLENILQRKDVEVYWCDHHKTSIDRMKDAGYMVMESIDGEYDIDIYGKKQYENFKGYFSRTNSFSSVRVVLEMIRKEFPEQYKEMNFPNLQYLVNLVSTWDIFDKKSPIWEKAVAFNSGTRIVEYELSLKEQIHPLKSFWEECAENRHKIDEIMKEGVVCEKFKKTEAVNRSIKSLGVLEFHDVLFFVLNTDTHGSMAFSDEVVENCSAMMTFHYIPALKKWKFGLYAGDKADPSQDLSKIAKMYGGGGHPKACGFCCDELPFDLNDIEKY